MEPMNLQGQSTEVAHHFFDLWQDGLEKEVNRMLSEHRPCHYAIENGSGQVIWVPTHSPCWLEGKSGKLVIDMAKGSRWLPPLHNGPANLTEIRLTSSVGIEEVNAAVPDLIFPRRQAWGKLPVLEFNLSNITKIDCCPLAKVRIYTEELRALRTAVQLMVKRTEESDAKQPSTQPAMSTMEPIQECSSEDDASGEPPVEEGAQEGAQGGPDSPKSQAPGESAEVKHRGSRSESPVRGCGCFGFGSRRLATTTSGARLSEKTMDPGTSQSLDEESHPTQKVSETTVTERGTSSSNTESVPEGAPASDAQEDDSAMLFYHESHQSAPNGSDAPLEKAVIKHKDRTYALSEDSAMAFDASQDRSSGDSTIHPAPVDPFTGASRQNVQPIDSPSVQPFNGHDNPFSSPDTAGPTNNVEGLPSQETPVSQKRATGASLPALLLSTAQAIGLGGLPGFSRSGPHVFNPPPHRHSCDGNASERQFLDTARGPTGKYHEAGRSAHPYESVPLPIRPHVWDAARLMAESQVACKEVWAPGYDHTPEMSDSEDQTDALPKPVSEAAVQYKPAKRDRQNPIIQQTPPGVTDSPPQTAAVPMQPQDNPFPAAAVPNQHQDPPLRDLDSARDEQPSETSVNFVAAAMSRMATQGVSGLGMGQQDTSRQDIGRQDSMLPSESRKLAHLALCAKEMPPKVRHSSATLAQIQQMRQALGRFPDGELLPPANGPVLAAQPAQNEPQLPMQPALSLTVWADAAAQPSVPDSAKEQAKLGSAMETQPAVQQNRDAGIFSNSDVEVDSPFASKSLPKEDQPVAKVFNKYAGTSDVIYENMNNPFDKHRGPPGRGRRRCNSMGRGSFTSSKSSSSSRGKSLGLTASSANKLNLTASPLSRMSPASATPSADASRAASPQRKVDMTSHPVASDTPAQRADASRAASPQRKSDLASHPLAMHEHEHAVDSLPAKAPSTDDSPKAESPPRAFGVPAQQVSSSQPALSNAAAMPVQQLLADLQPAATPAMDVPHEAERTSHSDDAPVQQVSHSETDWSQDDVHVSSDSQSSESAPQQQDKAHSMPVEEQIDQISQELAVAGTGYPAAGDVVKPTLHASAHLGQGESDKGLALQDILPATITSHPDSKSVEPQPSCEAVSCQPTQSARAEEAPDNSASNVHGEVDAKQDQHMPVNEASGKDDSELQAAPAPEHAQDAERPSSPPKRDTYYDTVSVQLRHKSTASELSIHDAPEEAPSPGQNQPGRAGSVLEQPPRPQVHSQGTLQEVHLDSPVSSSANSPVQARHGAGHGASQRSTADVGSVPSIIPEKFVAVTLRVKQPKPVGMVAAAIAALGLSCNAQQTPEEAVIVCIMPLSKIYSRSKMALSPDQLNATWYTGQVVPSATSARKPRQPSVGSSSGNRAAVQRHDAEESPDRAAAAVARLTEAGRGCEPSQRREKQSAQLTEAVGACQKHFKAVASRLEPQAGHAFMAHGEPTPEAVQHDMALDESPANSLQQLQPQPNAQAAANGRSTTDIFRQPLPDTALSSLAPNSQLMANRASTAIQYAREPALGAHSSSHAQSATNANPFAAATPIQRLRVEQPDQAAAMITPATRERHTATNLTQRAQDTQQRLDAAASPRRASSAGLALPQKPRWERPDQASTMATLGGGATMPRCASDAAQQAQLNRALVSELKLRLGTSSHRPSAASPPLKRKLSAQPSLGALGSPQEPGLLYKPELQSVADRVRYIERAHSREPAPLTFLTPESSLPHLLPTALPATLQEAA